MVEKILIAIGSLILLVLGSLHLRMTFFSNRFQPRNSQVEDDMKKTSPRLTSMTTMWNAWIGFNASHSLGAIYFAVVNLILTISFFNIYRESLVLNVFNTAVLLFYLFLARRYWFKIPLLGIFISSICFILAEILMLFNHA
jgi:hypothetical protein